MKAGAVDGGDIAERGDVDGGVVVDGAVVSALTMMRMGTSAIVMRMAPLTVVVVDVDGTLGGVVMKGGSRGGLE